MDMASFLEETGFRLSHTECRTILCIVEGMWRIGTNIAGTTMIGDAKLWLARTSARPDIQDHFAPDCFDVTPSRTTEEPESQVRIGHDFF